MRDGRLSRRARDRQRKPRDRPAYLWNEDYVVTPPLRWHSEYGKGQLSADERTERQLPRFNMDVEMLGHYLGQAMLTKGTTGLGVIQKPLKDKYFAFRKSSENRLGPEVGIRINHSGIQLLFPGSPSGAIDEFYDITSIHFVEAVRFVTMKKNKKTNFAFLPIAMDTANPVHDKLFTQLEKKFHHLTKISHPPLLACVMRRSTGVRAVDCHMFVIPSAEDAAQMASLVRRFQEHSSDYGQYENPSQIPSRDGYQKPDVIPSDQTPRDGNSAAKYALYRGGGVELRNEHFRKSGDYNNEPRHDGYKSDHNRSFEHAIIPGNRGHDPTVGVFDDRYRGNERNRLSADDVFVERRSSEFRSGGRLVERDSLGREYEFDNAITAGGRHRSDGDCRDPARNRSSDNIPPSMLVDTASRNKSVDSDEYKGFVRHSAIRTEYEDPPYAKPVKHVVPSPVNLRNTSPPRTRSPPPTQRPPAHEHDYISSPSNMESRQEMDAHGKPIAKVPPHRHAGIRVLPSLPIPGAKNQLKPVSPRPVAPTDGGPDDRAPTYTFDTQEGSDSDNPYDNAPDKQQHVNTRAFSDNTGHDTGHDKYKADRMNVKSDGYNYAYNRVAPSERVYEDRSTGNQQANPIGERVAGNNRPWSFGEEKEKFLRQEREVWQSDPKSRDARQPPAYGAGYERSGQHGYKDAEIESMFSNLRTGHGYRGSADFESSLGYLP